MNTVKILSVPVKLILKSNWTVSQDFLDGLKWDTLDKYAPYLGKDVCTLTFSDGTKKWEWKAFGLAKDYENVKLWADGNLNTVFTQK